MLLAGAVGYSNGASTAGASGGLRSSRNIRYWDRRPDLRTSGLGRLRPSARGPSRLADGPGHEGRLAPKPVKISVPRYQCAFGRRGARRESNCTSRHTCPRGAAGAGVACSINIHTPVGVPNALRSSYQPPSGTGSPGLHSGASKAGPPEWIIRRDQLHSGVRYSRTSGPSSGTCAAGPACSSPTLSPAMPPLHASHSRRSTASGAALSYRAVPAVEARQFRDGKHPIAPAAFCQAVHLKAEARQLVQRLLRRLTSSRPASAMQFAKP